MKQDVIVIGGGIIGLATAQYLLLQGATVTVLERHSTGQESSWAGGGILSPLCPWHYPEEVTRLTNYSAKLFPAWVKALYAATEIDPEYETSGLLILPTFDQQVAQQWCAIHEVTIETKTVSLPFYSATESASKSRQKWTNTLFLPDVAQVRNPRLLRALQKQVITLGGKIIENCPVHEIKTVKNTVHGLIAADRLHQAEHYIVTAGAWSQALLGKHGLKLQIKPVRGQILLYKFASPPIRHILLQDNLYLIPRRDGHLLVGSTLEEVGFDKSITSEARYDLSQRAQQLLPLLSRKTIKKQWAGLRPGSPRNVPTIGRHPLLRNLYINSGHYRYGVTMAPASAEILLNILTNAPQPFDTTAYQVGWGDAN